MRKDLEIFWEVPYFCWRALYQNESLMKNWWQLENVNLCLNFFMHLEADTTYNPSNALFVIGIMKQLPKMSCFDTKLKFKWALCQSALRSIYNILVSLIWSTLYPMDHLVFKM